MNQQYLQLERAAPAKGSSATYTFTFSQPVINAAFSIFDIDATFASGWVDAVSLTQGFGFTGMGSTLTGNGTTASPFTPSSPGTTGNLPGTDAGGNVSIHYVTTITSFQIVYNNPYSGPNASSGNQGIGLSDLTVTPTSC